MKKKEMVTTIQELIQKLKDSDISAFAVLESWVDECNCGRYDVTRNIFGFIWGLYSTKFITEYERICLVDYVENEYLSN